MGREGPWVGCWCGAPCRLPPGGGPTCLLCLLSPRSFLQLGAGLSVGLTGSRSRSCAQHPGVPKLCQVRAGGLNFPTSRGTPGGHAPPGPVPEPKQLPLAWLQAPCLFWSEEDCFSSPLSTHTLQSCLDKRVHPSQQPLSLAWDVSLASSPSLPCLSSASHQGHCTGTHTHRGTHMHTLAATCSHTYTCGHTHIRANTAKSAASSTETPPHSERHPHMSMCTFTHKGMERDSWHQGMKLGELGTWLLNIDSQALTAFLYTPQHTYTHTHTHVPATQSTMPPPPLLWRHTPHTAPAEPPAPCQTQRHCSTPIPRRAQSPHTGKCAPPPYLHLLTHSSSQSPPNGDPQTDTHREAHISNHLSWASCSAGAQGLLAWSPRNPCCTPGL